MVKLKLRCIKWIRSASLAISDVPDYLLMKPILGSAIFKTHGLKDELQITATNSPLTAEGNDLI